MQIDFDNGLIYGARLLDPRTVVAISTWWHISVRYWSLVTEEFSRGWHRASCSKQKCSDLICNKITRHRSCISSKYTTVLISSSIVTSKINLCTLTPWGKVFLEKLIVPHLIKKFLTFYKNKNVHCRIHKNLPLVSILGQLNAVHILTSHSFNMYYPFSTHLCQILRSRFFHLHFTRKISWISHLPSPMRATCPAHFILLTLITITGLLFSQQYKI